MAKNQKSNPEQKSNDAPQKKSQEPSETLTETTTVSNEDQNQSNQNQTEGSTETEDSSPLDDSTTDPTFTVGELAVAPGISTDLTDEEAENGGEPTDVVLNAVDGAPAGHIIRIGEPLTIPADKFANHALVTQDIYRERKLRGSNRVSYVLVYTAGTAIPLSALTQK